MFLNMHHVNTFAKTQEGGGGSAINTDGYLAVEQNEFSQNIFFAFYHVRLL